MTGAPPNSRWPDDRTARLIELWANGHTCAAIGIRLGVTKNAVIGKAHRLNLPQRLREAVAHEISETKKAQFAAGRLIMPSRHAVIPEPAGAPDMRNLSLLELEPNDCRFPIGDPQKPGFAFCGCPRFGERPYCQYHSRIAYVPRSTPKEVRAATARAKRHANWTVLTGTFV